MSTDIQTQAQAADSQAAANPPAIVPLDDVVNRIRHDSQHDAESYFDETTVPYGGE